MRVSFVWCAGKSTLMDILSMKSKSGRVHGEIYVNGTPVCPQQYRFKRAQLDVYTVRLVQACAEWPPTISANRG